MKRMLERYTEKNYDFIVVGGGMAGVCASRVTWLFALRRSPRWFLPNTGKTSASIRGPLTVVLRRYPIWPTAMKDGSSRKLPSPVIRLLNRSSYSQLMLLPLAVQARGEAAPLPGPLRLVIIVISPADVSLTFGSSPPPSS